ncbi:tRNA (adenosine(37)-N6)-threonylcarbamoyltransferase complex dimerization subunit type 1 TsaB [Nostocaceae cyanobacterium CENA357]|uniref:tRNA (Adenosine(37)-N6)-threonylcarbamoyltransferase complex dimerization subunit type 1 TsaB n=1 Tax=Atlanticothrix silvestris CENA357 TaxID=1725252 RepID=A0A8J7KYU6_9CYAN|nr:tRNA (adenosine(37)-N6)-threonylcarbamoyltransferase complex dimerization subunit type 1 TsaB [Atlanticothrix silvestris]MBH8551291.1 tRNA (adenosine(37)-N6)-threonylcarbamoyltransferase complex dimerization subunit type 1 TsaB [Atlanticothrix silvestris CENA357]
MTTELKQPTSQKYALSLHTTTPELGLAISNFAGETRTDVWNLGREVSSYIHQYLIEFIKPQTWADLAFIAVAKGPGGFTGTRIGVVLARTLGQQLDIPVFAISTLAAVAWSKYISEISSTPVVNQHNRNQAIAVEMPAQRGKIFAAIYQLMPDTCGLTALLPDTVFTPEAWQKTLANWNTDYQLVEAKSGLAATVTSILELAYLEWQQGKCPNWSEALPYYGQHPVEL